MSFNRKNFPSLDMTEEEKLIAELGKPKLGEKNITRVRIRESKEFKVKSSSLFSFHFFSSERMLWIKPCIKPIPRY